MEHDRKELEKALAVFERAETEMNAASRRYEDAVRKDMELQSGTDNEAKPEALAEAKKKAGIEKNWSRKQERLQTAILRVAGQNTAGAAANLLRKALMENENMQHVQMCGREFRDFTDKVLGDGFYMFCDDALYVKFTQGPEYVDQIKMVFPLDVSGKVCYSVKPSSYYVASYEEIENEVKMAAQECRELEGSLRHLNEREDEIKQQLVTDAILMMPSVSYDALQKPFDFCNALPPEKKK